MNQHNKGKEIFWCFNLVYLMRELFLLFSTLQQENQSETIINEGARISLSNVKIYSLPLLHTLDYQPPQQNQHELIYSSFQYIKNIVILLTTHDLGQPSWTVPFLKPMLRQPK